MGEEGRGGGEGWGRRGGVEEEGRVGEKRSCGGGGEGWERRGGVGEEGRGGVGEQGRDFHFHHHMCDKKCETMDHEGPSMSVIDHQLTLPLMFTSIPGVERRCSIQVVWPSLTARCNGV